MQKRDFLLLKNSSSFSGTKSDFDEQLGTQGGLQTVNRVHNLGNILKPNKARRQVQSHFEFSTANNAEGLTKYLDEGYQITAPSLVEINRTSGMEKQTEQKKLQQQPEYAASGVDQVLHQTANREQSMPKPNASNSNLRRQKSSNYSTKHSHAPQELPLSSSSSLSPQQRFFFDPNAQTQAGRRLPKKNHKTLGYLSTNTHNTPPPPSSSHNTYNVDTKKPSPLKKLTSAAESNLPQRKILTDDGKSSPILENICSSPQQTSWACLPRSLNTTNTSLFAECNKQVSHKTSLLFPPKYPQQQQASSSTSTSAAFSNSNPIYNNFTISPQMFSPQNNSKANEPNNNNNKNNCSNAPNSMYYSHPKSYLQSNLSSSKEEGSTMCLSIGLKSDVTSSNNSGRSFPLSVDSPAGHLLATEPLKRKVSPSRFKESQKLPGGGGVGGTNAVNSSSNNNNNRSCGIPFRQSWSSSKKQQSQIYNNSTQILQKDYSNSASTSQNTLNNETNKSKSISTAANNTMSANNNNNNNFVVQTTLINMNDSSQNYSARNPILNQSIPLQNGFSSQPNWKQPAGSSYPTTQPKQTHFELSKLFPLAGQQQQQQYLQPCEPCQQQQIQQQQTPVDQNQHPMKDISIRQEQSPNLLLLDSQQHKDISEIKRNSINCCNNPGESNNYSFYTPTTIPQDFYQQHNKSKQLVITLDCQVQTNPSQKSISKLQCSQPQSLAQQSQQQQQQSNNQHSYFAVKLSSPSNALVSSSYAAQQTTSKMISWDKPTNTKHDKNASPPQLINSSPSNSLTTTISSSKLPSSHQSALNRESSKQSCKIIQEKSVNRVNITLKNSNSKKLSSSTSSISEDTLDIRSTTKGPTSSRDSIHNYSSSNPTSPKIPKSFGIAVSDQQQDCLTKQQQEYQNIVLDGLSNSQAGLKSDSKVNNSNTSSASLLQMRKSLLFAKNANSTQTGDKTNGSGGKDNETDTAHVLFGNMIQVSKNKHIDLDDPIVQKEVSSIVRNLLKIKNDYKSPSSSNSSSSNSNNNSSKLKLKQQQQQIQAKQQLQQKQSTSHSNSQAGLKRQNSAGNQGQHSKLYSEIVNKFDVQHYKTVSGSSTYFEAIPEIGGGSSSSVSFVESQQTPENDSNLSANAQLKQPVQQGFTKKVQNSQGRD